MRVIGTFDLPFNYEMTFEGVVDSRMFCPTYADLLTYTESNYLINGFPVFVFDTDPTLRGAYQLVNNADLANPNSWEKVGLKPARTYLLITDGSNPPPITWATDTPPGGSQSYLSRHGAYPMIVEENLGDDGKWNQNASPAYTWNTDRSILSLYPQTQYTNFIII